MRKASEQGYTETWVKKTLEAKVPLDRVMKELARRLLEYKPKRKDDDWRSIPIAYRVHPIMELARVTHKRYKLMQHFD